MKWAHRTSLGPLVLSLWLISVVVALLDGPSWWWLAAYGAHFLIFTFGASFGLHRLVAHRAVEAPRWLSRAAAAVGALAQVGSPLAWRTVHLSHHRHSDTIHDPHAPYRVGWRLLWGAVEPLDKAALLDELLLEEPLRDGFLIGLHRYYYAVSLAYIGLCALSFGWRGVVYLALFPMGCSFLSMNLLNCFAHRSGRRSAEAADNSRNVVWLWPLTFGENWHANHHANPRAQTLRRRFFEIDMVYIYFWIARVFPGPSSGG